MSAPRRNDPIEAFYDAFPYPAVKRIVQPLSPVHTAGVLNELLRRRPSDALSSTPRVWVAGCGTQQGSTWGLTFPGGEVLATDVSNATLARARDVAAKLGARTTFARQVLGEEPPPGGGGFDVVVCTGVVHHLASPLAGLRNIRDALAPGGAASIMVYSRAHRSALEPLRRASFELARGAENPYEIACRVIAAARTGRIEPVARGLLDTLWALRESEPEYVADVLLNPREATYDVDRLVALLTEAGLRFVEWLYPASWKLGGYTDDPVLTARAAALGPMGEARVVQQIAGLSSPLLEVLVERDDAPVRPAYTRDERVATRMIASPGAREHNLVTGEVTPVPPFASKDGQIGGTARTSTPPGRHWQTAAEALSIIEAFDGTKTVAEVAEAFADKLGVDELLAMIEALGPREVGLLAPVLSASAEPQR